MKQQAVFYGAFFLFVVAVLLLNALSNVMKLNYGTKLAESFPLP